MEKLSTFATKREQHRIEIRAEKLKSLLSLKRQKFTIISPLNVSYYIFKNSS